MAKLRSTACARRLARQPHRRRRRRLLAQVGDGARRGWPRSSASVGIGEALKMPPSPYSRAAAQIDFGPGDLDSRQA